MPRKARCKRVAAADGTVVVRGKAPNGVGSVYLLNDGSWRATWTDRAGRRRFIRGSTHAQVLDRREAAQRADARAAEATRRVPSRFSPRTTTVNDVAAWWLDQQRHRVRAWSLGKYADRFDRCSTILGPELVTELTTEQVASWQSQLLDRLSPKTVADTARRSSTSPTRRSTRSARRASVNWRSWAWRRQSPTPSFMPPAAASAASPVAWWMALPVAALFMGIAHEIEHDAIHRLYFTRNKKAQHVIFAVVWLLRPCTISPWARRPLHLLHHEVSGTPATSKNRASPTANGGVCAERS